MINIDRFQVACTADIAQIASMVNLAYRPESGSSAWTHESDLVDGCRTNFDFLSELISKSDSTIIIGIRNNSLVGCIHLEKEGRDCHLGLFAVHPNFQGQGIGKKLLEFAEQFAQKQYHSENFVMTVLSARHELIEFYLRRGYRRTGVISSYPISAGIGTPKQLDLEIEKLEKKSTHSTHNLHLNASRIPMNTPDIPVAVMAKEVSPRTTPSIYPQPFASRMVGREKRALGDLFGLSNFGVNLTKLAPAAGSALRHAHSKQDEFIYILQGSPILISDDGETPLFPGMCAGFKAGTGNAHQLINRSNENIYYLEVGDRSAGDSVQYPDDDLQAQFINQQWQFAHKDGSPY